MKKTLVLTALALALTACGGDDHSKVYAVDVVETAEQNAKAATPVAQPITFDDENAPKAGETAATETKNDTVTDGATTDTKADEKPAEDKKEADNAEAKADDKSATKAKPEEAKPEETKSDEKK